MSTPSIRLSPRRIAMTPGRSGMSSARRPSSSSRSRPSSIGRVSRREESLAPNTRSPFDVYIKADELMFMDVCDVSSVRLFELVNVPAPFIFDRSVLANIPTMPYRLRHSVVVRFERHNVGVFRHPTNEPLVVIPFTCLTDVIAFESDMAGIHGIRVDGDDGLSISFVMDDARRRVLLFKLMALGMNCELPPYMDVIRSRRSASRPNSTHHHRSVQHNQPFENANGDVLSVGREPTPPYETEGMEQGAGCTTHPSSDQSGKSENPTSNHEESGTNVYTRSLTHHSNQSDTINRPTETMPTTHDVHAATMKAQRRQEVETRLELERRKRIQGLSHSN